MKRRKTLELFGAFFAALSLSVGVVACSSPNIPGSVTPEQEETEDPRIREIYELAVASGATTLTYEEWLASIRGENGQDGRDGTNGLTPYIGDNGNWWIGNTDTHIPATGPQGDSGNPVANAYVDERGDLIIVYLDGVESNLGHVGSIASKCTVNFIVAGTIAHTIEVDCNSKIAKPSDDLFPAYVISGWYSDESLTEQWNFKGCIVDEDINLYAKFQLKSFKANIYETNGDLKEVFTLRYGDNYNFSFGYNGLYYETIKIKDSGEILPLTGTYLWTHDIDLEWCVTYDPHITLNLDPNGGTLPGSSTMIIEYGSSYSLPTPTNNELYFAGWYLGNDLISLNGYWTLSYENTFTLVARWIDAPVDPKTPEANCYTYETYSSSIPTDWNVLNSSEQSGLQLNSYSSSNFFCFDYKFDGDGNVVPGDYTVKYDAVSHLDDVTESYAGDANYGVPNDATEGYAYKFTLRNDLKWDDGTTITANDFVYSMKEQLNPEFNNNHADNYVVGSCSIYNADEYREGAWSGMLAASSIIEESDYSEELDNQLIFQAYTGSFDVKENSKTIDWFLHNYSSYQNYLHPYYPYAGYETGYGIFSILNITGYPNISIGDCRDMSSSLDGMSLQDIKNDTELDYYYNLLKSALGVSDLELCVIYCDHPAIDFDKVGLFTGANENELIMILSEPLKLLKDDGSLSFEAAYNFGGLPLVKEELYEECKVEPVSEGLNWTSTYCSSVATSASWGPYKLTYINENQYILDRNEYWFGYNMPEYDGQYQTDRILCNKITDYSTALALFENGFISDINVQYSDFAKYCHSSKILEKPSDYVGSLQLQSNAEALAGRETAGIDKEMLNYVEFRKALSLAIDRDDYAVSTTNAYQAGLGLFNSMHYHAAEDGLDGLYRNTDDAKVALCNVYGVDPDNYDTLDEAVAAIGNGQNLDLARELLNKAYDEAIEAGTISASDRVVLTYGSSIDNESARRHYNYLKQAFETLAVGTKLEGRLTLDFDASFGTSWSNDFRAGAYDICVGGWSGAPWDPGYLLIAYLSPSLMYSKSWDTAHQMLTYNPYKDGNPDNELTLSLTEWWNRLRGSSSSGIDWSKGKLSNELRAGIIAQLEQAILETYYCCPLTNGCELTLYSYKIGFAYSEYNSFVGFGGIRYLTYNYDDLAWSQVRGAFDYTV